MKWLAQWRENRFEATQDLMWLRIVIGRVTYWRALIVAVLGILFGLVFMVMLITSDGPRGLPSKDGQPEFLIVLILFFGSFAMMAWGLTFAAVLGISLALLKQVEDLKRRLDEREGGGTPQDGAPKA